MHATASCVMHMSLDVQAFAVCYGVTAGLRGYLFSLINADLIQVCFSFRFCGSAGLHSVNMCLGGSHGAHACSVCEIHLTRRQCKFSLHTYPLVQRADIKRPPRRPRSLCFWAHIVHQAHDVNGATPVCAPHILALVAAEPARGAVLVHPEAAHGVLRRRRGRRSDQPPGQRLPGARPSSWQAQLLHVLADVVAEVRVV